MDARRLRSRLRAAAAIATLATAVGAAAPVAAQAQIERIPVTATLDGCDGDDANRVCRIVVSFQSLSEARQYQTSITAPDGVGLIDAAAEPGETTYSIAYRGNGTYIIRVTAYR